MTGISLVFSFSFKRRHVSNPSMPGITTSKRMRSGLALLTCSRAASPFSATETLKPEPRKKSHSNLKFSGLSATIQRVSFYLSLAIDHQSLTGHNCCKRVAFLVHLVTRNMSGSCSVQVHRYCSSREADHSIH